MNWLSKTASWISDKASDAYDSVKSGAAFVTGITARDNYKRAERIVRNAQEEFETAVNCLDESRKQCSSEFEGLGRLRLKVEKDQMSRFVETIKPITNVEYTQLKLEQYAGDQPVPSLKNIEISAYEARDVLKDGVQAVSAGTLAGVGALGIATSFGVASTGTAISTLTGAAATNATLAWLGGGSLAAGGLGVAGGTAVLGGIVAIPVILVFASKATARSEQALTQAFEQEAQYEIATKEAEMLVAKLACVISRTQEVFETTLALSERFQGLLLKTQALVSKKTKVKAELSTERDAALAQYARRFFLLRWIDKLLGRVPSFSFPDPLDFNNFTAQEKDSYLMTVNFGFELYRVLKVKILEENGGLAPGSVEAVNAGRTLLGDTP